MKTYKILVINLGSTSTKVAFYENGACIFTENIKHSMNDLNGFADLMDQYQYRYDSIMGLLNEKKISLQELDCVISRGGHTKPLTGGVYKINELMLEQSASRKYGFHPCDIGLKIAFNIEKQAGPVALTAYPPVTDEFEPLARYSGLPEIQRISAFQALNHKAVGKKYASDEGKRYEDLHLIIIHMGGGISVVCHKKGKMVDGNNALFGDGPFSTNRSGGLPIGGLVDLCFSGKTHAEIMKMLTEKGGLVAYLGENDVKKLEERALTDSKCDEVLEAMCYQVAKEIGGAAAVFDGKVDAIIFTGGMAYSKRITDAIIKRVSFIAPVVLYPGEFEMESLGLFAYNALSGSEEIKYLI